MTHQAHALLRWQTRQVEQRALMLSQRRRRWTNIISTYYTYYTLSCLLGACSQLNADRPANNAWPRDIIWPLGMRTDEPPTPPCGKAVGQCDAARSNLYRWTSQHDADVVREHQDIVENVTEFPEASRHLLKPQGTKLKCHGAVTLGRFGGNPDYYLFI